MTIENTITKEFTKARRRNWNKIYVFVDFHEVILVPDYQSNNIKVEYYPFAKELLQYLTERPDVCLITWTCSHPYQIKEYLKEMLKDGIDFDYINCNPEVSTNEKYGYYKTKPYYNIILDDKGGVVPEDLKCILEAFKEQELLCKYQEEILKFKMYCCSEKYPVGFITYDERKYPEPPYNKFLVKRVIISNTDLKIEKITIANNIIYDGTNEFIIGSGHRLTVYGIWNGKEEQNIEVRLIGELI